MKLLVHVVFVSERIKKIWHLVKGRREIVSRGI